MRLSGADREYILHQWANDWLSLDAWEGLATNGRAKDGSWLQGIVSPLRAVLNAEEVERLLQDYEEASAAWEAGQQHRTGTFWKQWRLITNDAGTVGMFVAQ